MKKLWLCADDYGLSPLVSEAIEELVRAGRLNAFSVMVDGPEIDIHALRALRRDFPDISIGLHLTLTRCFEARPSLQSLMLQAFTGLLPNQRAEISRQFMKFEELTSVKPDHVDGHQHVHLLPGIRAFVIELMPQQALFRQCRGAGVGFKAKIIDRLSKGLPQDLRVNPTFSGSYHFMKEGDYRVLFKQFLANKPDQTLIMCHPGRVDDLLKSRDPIHEDRVRELAYFKSQGFLDDLTEADFVL